MFFKVREDLRWTHLPARNENLDPLYTGIYAFLKASEPKMPSNHRKTHQTSMLTPYDPEGLPFDPLESCQPTP